MVGLFLKHSLGRLHQKCYENTSIYLLFFDMKQTFVQQNYVRGIYSDINKAFTLWNTLLFKTI